MTIYTKGKLKRYSVVYADPPWSYNQFQGKGTKYGDVSAHYQTMTKEELEQFPINNFADSKNCVLFMWATFPNLPQAIELVAKWGFEYKTVAFVWIKTRKEGYYSGLGFYTNSNAEIVIIAKRGQLERKNKNVKQLVFSPLEQHSQKPNEVRQRIVDLYGDIPRIELFARERFHGWDSFGNQLPNTIQEILN